MPLGMGERDWGPFDAPNSEKPPSSTEEPRDMRLRILNARDRVRRQRERKSFTRYCRTTSGPWAKSCPHRLENVRTCWRLCEVLPCFGLHSKRLQTANPALSNPLPMLLSFAAGSALLPCSRIRPFFPIALGSGVCEVAT